MRPLGELEAVVMDRMWGWDGPVTVREVVENLQPERPLAYTTVMTVMDNLHRKGWLRREMAGRAYRYRPAGSREAYSADLMNQALATSKDPLATLVHFAREMTPEEAQVMRDALRRRRR